VDTQKPATPEPMYWPGRRAGDGGDWSQRHRGHCAGGGVYVAMPVAGRHPLRDLGLLDDLPLLIVVGIHRDLPRVGVVGWGYSRSLLLLDRFMPVVGLEHLVVLRLPSYELMAAAFVGTPEHILGNLVFPAQHPVAAGGDLQQGGDNAATPTVPDSGDSHTGLAGHIRVDGNPGTVAEFRHLLTCLVYIHANRRVIGRHITIDTVLIDPGLATHPCAVWGTVIAVELQFVTHRLLNGRPGGTAGGQVIASASNRSLVL